MDQGTAHRKYALLAALSVATASHLICSNPVLPLNFSIRLKVRQPSTRYLIDCFVLQVIFHHMFLELVKDIGHHVVSTGEYGLEFANDGAFLLVFIRFWHADQLCRVFMKKTGRTQGQNPSDLTLVAHVMGALSTEPHIVSVTGSTVHTVQQLDYSCYSNYAVQSPPRFEELQLRTLMHKKSSSVFGKIDFFGVLQYLIVSQGPSLELDWVLLSPELSKVSSFSLSYNSLVERDEVYTHAHIHIHSYHFLGNSDVSA